MSVYLDAIRLLERRGWTKGQFETEDHRLCMRGALRVALGGTAVPAWNYDELTDVDAAEQQLLHVLLPVLGVETVTKFNDSPHTTYEDVVLALKRAHEASEATP